MSQINDALNRQLIASVRQSLSELGLSAETAEVAAIIRRSFSGGAIPFMESATVSIINEAANRGVLIDEDFTNSTVMTVAAIDQTLRNADLLEQSQSGTIGGAVTGFIANALPEE